MINRVVSTVIWLLGCLLLLPSDKVLAQGEVDPSAERRLLYFDEPVGLPKFYKTSVYRAWNESKRFFLLPSGVSQRQGSIAVQYRLSNGKLTGNLTLTIEPAFDEEEFKSLVTDLKSVEPAGTFSVVEPTSSEWDILGFGMSEAVTPPLMSNPLLSPVSISVPLSESLLRVLLHEGSQYADAFVVRHKFAVRGFELDTNMRARLANRWFSRGTSFTGNCKETPERFLDVISGKSGCLFKIDLSRSAVGEIQTLLKQLGFYRKEIDGQSGPYTRSAVRAFQRSVGYNQDGELSPKILDDLRRLTGKAAKL